MKPVLVMVICLAVGFAAEVAAQRAMGLGSLVHIGGSSRAIALGRAYTALAGDDALGAFWNPAAVAYGTGGPRVAVSNRFFGEQDFGMDGPLSFVTAGGTVPVWNGFVGGLGLMYLGVSGVEEYDDRAVFLGDFSHAESLLLVSVGRMSGPIAVGLSGKMLRQEFSGLSSGPSSGAGVGFEVGLVARFWRPVRIGVTLRDEIDVDLDRAPMTALVGVSYERRVYVGAPGNAVAALDFEQIKNRPLRIHVGLGLEDIPAFGDVTVAVRGGLSNRMLEHRLTALLTDDLKDAMDAGQLAGDSDQLTLGLGLTRGALRIDYTISLGLMHDPQYISLGYYHL